MANINDAIRRVSTNKALSIDMFPDTLLKSDEYLSKLSNYTLDLLNGSEFPSQYLAIGRLLLLSKTDSTAVNPTDTRPITINSPIWKLIESCLLCKYEASLWNTISISQIGFRPGCTTQMHVTELQLQILRYIKRITNSKITKKGALIFIDFSKAFDSINREYLMSELIRRNVFDPADLQLLSWYFTHSAFVYDDTKYHTQNGVPQGSLLSPLLFTIVLDPFIRLMESKSIFIYAYADDCASAVESYNQYNLLMNELERLKTTTNLQWNQKQTEIMPLNWPTFESGGIKQVNQYKYLGIILYNKMHPKKGDNAIQNN